MAEKKKKTSVFSHLKAEWRSLSRPTAKVTWKQTGCVIAGSLVCAGAIAVIDMGCTTLMRLIMNVIGG